MKRIVILRDDKAKAQGLIGLKPIPEDTYFVFPDVKPGTVFHSRGVLEPFDIAFVNEAGKPILITEVVPPDGLIAAPLGTVLAIESKAGGLRGFSGLGQVGRTGRGAHPIVFTAIVFALGLGIGAVGFIKRKTLLGAILLGAAGSISGAAFVLLLDELLRPNLHRNSVPLSGSPRRA